MKINDTGDDFVVTSVQMEPGQYAPQDIRRVRDLLHSDQAHFAVLLGVTTEQLQEWEAGTADPPRIARRLLDLVMTDPSVLFRSLQPPS